MDNHTEKNVEEITEELTEKQAQSRTEEQAKPLTKQQEEGSAKEQTEEQPEYTDPNKNVKYEDLSGDRAGYHDPYMQNPSDYTQGYTYVQEQPSQDTDTKKAVQYRNTNYEKAVQSQNTGYEQPSVQFQNAGYGQPYMQSRDVNNQKIRQPQNAGFGQEQQYQQYQNQYHAVYQQQYQYQNQTVPQMDNSPMSMGDWLLTILATFLPCAGVILYFIWAFGSHGNVNRRNYCRAMLIVMGGLLVVYIFIFMITGVIGTSYYYY